MATIAFETCFIINISQLFLFITMFAVKDIEFSYQSHFSKIRSIQQCESQITLLESSLKNKQAECNSLKAELSLLSTG